MTRMSGVCSLGAVRTKKVSNDMSTRVVAEQTDKLFFFSLLLLPLYNHYILQKKSLTFIT